MSDDMNFDQQPEARSGLRLAARTVQPAPEAAAGPQPMQQDVGQEIEEPHLLDYVKVLVKRRWTAATAFLLVFVSVTVYTFTATPIFEASARLLIEADEQNVVAFKQVVDEDRAKADYYQTQYNILQSRSLARKTIEALKLWDNPLFGGGAKAEAGASTGAVAYVTGFFRSAPEPSAPAEADETLGQSRTIDAFLSHLAVEPIRNSRLVDVKYRLPDAALATSIVNTLSKGYIQQNLEYKFMASKEATDWLGERLTEQRQGVEQAETKLQQYREQNDAISLQDRENIVVQKLGDLNAAVTKAKTERLQKEALYKQLSSLETDRAALDTFPAILGNSFIQQQKGEIAALQRQLAQLSEKLGDKHPDIVRLTFAIESSQIKLDAEIGKVVQSVKNEYQASQVQEQSLAAALGQQKGEALSMNRKGIEYSVLDRELQSNKQIYESLMQRAKETGVSGELKTSNIRIVDQAERPRGAVSPRKALNLALASLGGGMLAFGLAFFFEYLDSRIKTPDEIKAYLGLPSLGMVPALAAKSWTGAEPLINGGVPPGFAEAFRGIRTNVLFSTADEGARTLVVTSTGSGGRKDDRGVQPGDWPGADRPAGADHRLGHAASACALGVQPAAGAGPLELPGGQRQAERDHAQDQRAQPVAVDGRAHPAESGGADRIAALQGLRDVAEGAFRLGDHRHAAGDGRHGRGDRGKRRLRRGVRRRGGDDQPPGRQDRRRAARERPRQVCRCGAEPGGDRQERVLLLEVLPSGIRGYTSSPSSPPRPRNNGSALKIHMVARHRDSLRARFSRGLLVASVAQAVGLGVSLFLVGYVVSTAGLEAWGLITLATSTGAILSTVDLAASSGLSQRLTKALAVEDSREFSRWFTTGVFLQLVAAAAVALGFIAYSFATELHISASQAISAEAPMVFALVVTSVILTTLTLPYNACLLASNRVDIYSGASLLAACARLLITLITFRVVGAGATAYAFSLLAGAAAQTLVVFLWVRANIEAAKIDRRLVNGPTVKSLLALNALVLFNTLNHTFFLQLPVFALQRAAGITDVATWGIGLQVANSMRALATPGYNALWPAITTLRQHAPLRLGPVFRVATKTAFTFGMLFSAATYIGLFVLQFSPEATLSPRAAAAVLALVVAAAVGVGAMPAAAVSSRRSA